MLPNLARVLHEEYGAAAVDAADSGEAAINRMLTAWTDLKVSMSNTDAAVDGIEVLTKAMQATADAMPRIADTIALPFYEVAAAIAVVKGEMDFSAWAGAGSPSELRAALVRAGLEKREKYYMENAGNRKLTPEELAFLDANPNGGTLSGGQITPYGEHGKTPPPSTGGGGGTESKTYSHYFDAHIKDYAAELERRRKLLETFDRDYRELTIGETEFEIEEVRARSRVLQDLAKDDSEKVAQIKEWEAATVKEIQDKAHKESAEANQRAAEDLKRQARVMLEESDSILDGVRLGFMLSEESAVSTARSIADVMGDSMRTTKDHITDMVQSGKFEFEDLFNYVERRAIDLMISQPATNALMSGMSMMFSGIGGFAYGGVSHGPQLAWVSEGPYDTEAHVPMLTAERSP